MALILHIETSGPVCSVSLARDGETLAVYTPDTLNDHMTGITDHIHRVCTEAGVVMGDLQAVTISAGPGSYTGLRIGTSAAKGICHALGIPLITIPTPEAMVSAMLEKYRGQDVLFCPLIDARRMEVYTMLADTDGTILLPPFAYIVTSPAFDYVPAGKPCVYFGSGLEKCLDHLPAGAVADRDYTPSAEHLHSLANRQYSKGIFADMPYFEPLYLKDFYTPIKK